MNKISGEPLELGSWYLAHRLCPLVDDLINFRPDSVNIWLNYLLFPTGILYSKATWTKYLEHKQISQSFLDSAQDSASNSWAFPDSAWEPQANSQFFLDSAQEPASNSWVFPDSAWEPQANSQFFLDSAQEPASNSWGFLDCLGTASK